MVQTGNGRNQNEPNTICDTMFYRLYYHSIGVLQRDWQATEAEQESEAEGETRSGVGRAGQDICREEGKA